MSTCTKSRYDSSKSRYDAIRDQRAPLGVDCPYCHTNENVYFSSAQLRRPIYKRAFFAYLRCHACTHRFRHLKIGSLAFLGVAVAIFVVAGVLG